MPQLVFPVTAIEQLRTELFDSSNNEKIAFAYAGESDGRYLATEIHPVPDDELRRQTPTSCRAEYDVEQRHIQQCLSKNKHPVLIHSHPFAETEVSFSPIDTELMPEFSAWVTRLFPETEVLYAVLGTHAVEAAIVKDGNIESIPVEIPGSYKLSEPVTYTSPRAVRDDEGELNEQVYDRSIRCFSEAGQQRLATTRAAVIGAGGLGSILCEQLLRVGITDLVVIDPDIVEESNLNRLQGAWWTDIDRSKVRVVQERLQQYNPKASVEAYQKPVQKSADVLRTCDLLVAGVDSMNARMWLNEFAVKHLRPYVDAGVVIEKDDDTVTAMRGAIQTIIPGATGCLKCADRYNPEQAERDRLNDEELAVAVERGYIEETELSPAPAVMPLNTTIAGKTADVVTKLVTGFAPPDDYIQYESMDASLTELRTQPFDSCTVCHAENGVLGRGATTPDLDDLAVESEESLTAI